MYYINDDELSTYLPVFKKLRIGKDCKLQHNIFDKLLSSNFILYNINLLYYCCQKMLYDFKLADIYHSSQIQ